MNELQIQVPDALVRALRRRYGEVWSYRYSQLGRVAIDEIWAYAAWFARLMSGPLT